ncbi:MAG: transglycosylase SLT domain-containing protein [Thermoleophilia bacterium]
MRRLARAGGRGQALPLVLAVALLVVLGAGAVFALGRAQLAASQAQTTADLAAISAARELRDRFGEMARDGAGERGRWTARLSRIAREAAAATGGRIESVEPVGAAWPPAAVQVVASRAGPAGTRARARARAGLRASVAAGDGRRGWATGGGYSGPLVYRDGKPMCPAVGAAYDLMHAAARADGVTLSVSSGFRSDAEQAILFARHPDPKWVAPPGRSRHRDATELDLNMGTGGSAHAWLARNATRFGFVQRYSWEPWHYGYLPGCGAVSGTPAGASGDGEGDGGARPIAVPDAAAGLPGWVPGDHRATIAAAATANGIAPVLLAALLSAESGFDPRAVSPVGAQGIAQFMPATARGMGLRDPFDPAQAIPAAARLLSGHVRRFGSVPLALAAYNAGPGAVERHGGIPPYPETQAYVARIMALAGGAGALAMGGGDGVVLLPVEDAG